MRRVAARCMLRAQLGLHRQYQQDAARTGVRLRCLCTCIDGYAEAVTKTMAIAHNFT